MPEDTISQVASAVRAVTLESFQAVNSCIESTRLGLLVFDRLGIRARAQAVKVAIMNRESWALIQQGAPMNQWPPTAWSLGIGFHEAPLSPTGWNGHLVAIVRQPDSDRRLVDISADQFDRPGRISVPGPVGMSITGPWSPMDPKFRILQNGDTILDYRPFAPHDPIGNAYKEAPAWTKDPEWFDAAADHIVKNLG